jgi:hypothetical protein
MACNCVNSRDGAVQLTDGVSRFENMEGGAAEYKRVEHISSCPEGLLVGSNAEAGVEAWKWVRQGCSSLIESGDVVFE